MITERYVETDGARILFRLAVAKSAILDILTDAETLDRCRQMLREATVADGPWSMRMGSFGPFGITLSLGKNFVSILVDGPDLDGRFAGNQGAGIYVERQELLDALGGDEDWIHPSHRS